MSSIARVLSEGSQIVDFFEEGREIVEQKQVKKMAKEQVDKEVFKKGLYCLGKTHNGSAHAFLSIDINNQELRSIEGI